MAKKKKFTFKEKIKVFKDAWEEVIYPNKKKKWGSRVEEEEKKFKGGLIKGKPKLARKGWR